MKTKLSFLALPLCLGLALIFALAACGGGGSDGEGSSNSNGSNSSPTPYSSAVKDDDGFITFDPDAPTIEVWCGGNKCYLLGNISAPPKVPIKKLEFIGIPSDAISYTGAPVTESSNTTSISLNDAEIDLTKSSITCGEHTFTVKVCLDAACSAGKYATKNGTFAKPSDFCQSSSPSVMSSSSVAMWKFGAKETAQVGDGGQRNIGSASITLRDEAMGGIDVVSMSVSNGRVRYTNINFDINGFVGGYPVPNTDYPHSIFNLESPEIKIAVQINEYYLIIPNSGDKYLVRVEPKDGPDGSQGVWPKVVQYWKAEGGPEL